eukprot:jgi/Ulvmu1/9801/UM056_0041.1
MFGLIHGCLEHALRKEELHILILGLDKAGKTTLLEKMKEMHGLPGLEWDKILPTVGLNVGRIEAHNSLLIFWDLGGQVGLRSIWDKYYDEAHAVVYVVDAADEERIFESKAALAKVLGHRDLVSAPLLVLANKQDLPGSMGPAAVASELGLSDVDTRPHRVQPVSAHHGVGITDGLQWIVNAVKSSPRLSLLRRRARGQQA